MVASEAQPFSKTGGLADVATALPKALGRLGHDVTVVTPRYRGIAPGAPVAVTGCFPQTAGAAAVQDLGADLVVGTRDRDKAVTVAADDG